jgi:hypothetical protein
MIWRPGRQATTRPGGLVFPRRDGQPAKTCLRYYTYLFAEFDPGVRVSAEELIRKARSDAGGRRRW